MTTESGAVPLSGYLFRWSSTAYGERGPSRFVQDAFGRDPIKVPLLWSHDQAKPIGVSIVTPDDVGGRLDGQILTAIQQGREAIALYQSGASTGFSAGFTALQSHHEGGIRIITKAELHEASLVVFPADRTARADSVGGVPVFHAANPKELETMTTTSDVMRIIHEAEAWLYGDKPKPREEADDVLDFDFFRGRMRTPEEREQQARSARFEKMYRLLQKDPALCRLGVGELNVYIDSIG